VASKRRSARRTAPRAGYPISARTNCAGC